MTSVEASEKKKITVEIKVPEELLVFADQNMLRSLFRNLISNAIKFTPDNGTVCIAASYISKDCCLISVKDSGIGMSKNLQQLLFKMDVNNSRKGTNGEMSCGLGLLLCKEFVNMHQGEIWTESEEGKGSTFYVKLSAVPFNSASGTH